MTNDKDNTPVGAHGFNRVTYWPQCKARNLATIDAEQALDLVMAKNKNVWGGIFEGTNISINELRSDLTTIFRTYVERLIGDPYSHPLLNKREYEKVEKCILNLKKNVESIPDKFSNAIDEKCRDLGVSFELTQ